VGTLADSCMRACSLGIAAQIKIMGDPSLVFSGLYFDIYLRLPPRKYEIMSWKKKEFKDLVVLLISFGLYFIKVEVGWCFLPCTIYYNKYMLCNGEQVIEVPSKLWLFQKKK
jgi:hypothetical protein